MSHEWNIYRMTIICNQFQHILWVQFLSHFKTQPLSRYWNLVSCEFIMVGGGLWNMSVGSLTGNEVMKEPDGYNLKYTDRNSCTRNVLWWFVLWERDIGLIWFAVSGRWPQHRLYYFVDKITERLLGPGLSNLHI